VDGVMACVEKDVRYEIFNLGESQTVTLSRLIELLELSLGKKAIIQRLTAQAGDVPLTYAGHYQVAPALRLRPKVKIDQGIPLFVEWFKQQAQ